MKYAMLFALTICLLAHPAKNTSNEDVAAHITKLDHEWTTAYIKKDIKKLESLMAEDFVTTDPTGTTYLNGREQNIGPVKRGEVVYESFDVENVNVRVHGDTAIAVGKFTMKGKANGETFQGRYAYTESWVKRNGKWQAVAEHITEVKTATP